MLGAQLGEARHLARLRWRVMLSIFALGALTMSVSTFANYHSGEGVAFLRGASFWVAILLGVVTATQLYLRRPSPLLERLALAGVIGLFIYQFVGLISGVYVSRYMPDKFSELVPWLSVIYVAAFIVYPTRFASWLVASLLGFVTIFWGRRALLSELYGERFFGLEALTDTLISSIIVVTLLFFFKRITEVGARAEARALALETLANTDSLTGLPNRRYLAAMLQAEYARAYQQVQPLSVVICDLDHFKQVNDSFSHAVGDQVLVEVADLLRANTRRDDYVSRHGGEEFVIVLPRTDHQQALQVCEKIRASIQHHDWASLHPDLRMTASFGICSDLSLATYEAMLAEADARLYAAKRAGRNRVA